MSHNTKMKRKLENKYGIKCMMHEGLKIEGYKKCKGKYNGKPIISQLTVHHIKAVSNGGKTTIENCALLCRGCHDYLEESNPDRKAKLNLLLKQYKEQECKVTFVEDIESEYSMLLIELEVDEKEQINVHTYNRAKSKRKTTEYIKEYDEREER